MYTVITGCCKLKFLISIMKGYLACNNLITIIRSDAVDLNGSSLYDKTLYPLDYYCERVYVKGLGVSETDDTHFLKKEKRTTFFFNTQK